MNYRVLFLFALVLLTSFSKISGPDKPKNLAYVAPAKSTAKSVAVYEMLNANSFAMPNLECFSEALDGFYALKDKGIIQKDILTLIDFSKSSNTKRLWVIDLKTNTILFNTLVAHGRNTGEEFAQTFSNAAESFKSSLGFYATGEVYNGKHGLSLRLDGLEKGINDHARERAVVVHGANYVSESFIKGNKRLGRSQGCPAVPVEMNEKIINVIKDKSCLFIFHPSRSKTTFEKLVS
ncbi:murein L,D-transpeptidase catalytic domain family protein [Flavobacterium silvisoli]|uniref:Murein L,D-transpeptidase catalytic domain family protein n=1 Tax=Flavobacterium silvisoli TaxID=2529433 RepID=A0A4Q9Z2N3_9FLAO|nr:murein L,D-transpeptidase catalytic domain family protein [Flavobacterium silvisoli]TBX69538.1 murein L,D-transpeptidase catalytic domain family protein [Flavobacterium silvisoli]